jgi:peptidyl-tRNA hydrolase
MRFVFNRFRLGLATASESKDLAEYVLQNSAVDNEHQRALSTVA